MERSLYPPAPAANDGPSWLDREAAALLPCTGAAFLRRALAGATAVPSVSVDEPGLRLVAAACDEGRARYALLTADAAAPPGARAALRFFHFDGAVVEHPLPLAAPSALAFADRAHAGLVVGGDGRLCRFDERAGAVACELDAVAAAPLDVAPLENGAFVYHDGRRLFHATAEETRMSDVAQHMGCGPGEAFAPGALAVGYADALYLLACGRAAVFDEHFDFKEYVPLAGASLVFDPCGNAVTLAPAARTWRVYDRTPWDRGAGPVVHPLAGEGRYAGVGGALGAGRERAVALTGDGRLVLASATGLSFI